MTTPKEKRAREAAARLALKRARETNALSVSFLRALSARAILHDELQTVKRRGLQSAPDFNTAVQSLHPNAVSRLATMHILYFASLNVVVEGWQDPNQAAPALSDARVDALLTSPFVKKLADFRNAMMHPNPLLDRRLIRFAEKHPDLLAWSEELCEELYRYFRSWRRALIEGAALERDARSRRDSAQ